MARPFIKYVGGKRRLCVDLEEQAPKKINTYYEPMVGGGAFFFYLHERVRFRKAVLGDLSPELMTTYLVVRDDLPKLLYRLEQHAPHAGNTEYYNALRKQQDLVDPIEVAARMLYLNKTCFNGLYRVNAKGEFNVPHGGCNKTGALDRLGYLSDSSRALQGTHLACGSYERTTKGAVPGDFIYVDPPYLPLSKTAKFVEFSGSFDYYEQEKLARWAKTIVERRVAIVLSNHDTLVARELYSDPCWELTTLDVQRSVAADGAKRVRVPELIIRGRV